MINGEEEEGEQFLEVKGGDNNVIMVEKERVEEYRLSINTLADSQARNTIRIGGNCRDLIILIDSGSTHRFIDGQVVKKIRTTIKKKKTLCWQ